MDRLEYYSKITDRCFKLSAIPYALLILPFIFMTTGSTKLILIVIQIILTIFQVSCLMVWIYYFRKYKKLLKLKDKDGNIN